MYLQEGDENMSKTVCRVCGEEFNTNSRRPSTMCGKCMAHKDEMPEFDWSGPSSEELHEEARKVRSQESVEYQKRRYQNDPEYRARVDAMVPKHQKWSNDVKSRDGVCQVCGENHDLEAHHIVPKSQDPSRKYDVDNGITLCRDCHRSAEYSIHRQLGVNYSPVEFGIWFNTARSVMNR